MQAPIYIVGISPRSGTNFLYDLLRFHPSLDAARTVEEDFLLFGADHLKDYVHRVAGRWDTGWGMSNDDVDELLQSMGQAGLEFLQRRQAHPEKRLLTKTPEAHNLPLFFQLFPNAQPIIIVRDGRAVVESKMKSFDAEFVAASRAWASAAEWIFEFQEKTSPDKFRLVRYEDLYQDTKELVRSLLEFLDLDPSVYPFEKIDEMPVRGSSAHFGAAGELNWDPVAKTDSFKPMERFSHWTFEQHVQFNALAGKQMTRLGYELKGPVFMRANLDRSAYSKDVDVISQLDTGSRVLMPRESADMLMGLDNFRSLHEHFNRNMLDIGELPKFVEFYLGCESNGLLLSQEDLLAPLRKPAPDAERAEASGPTSVFIRTCERPAYLERFLSSLLQLESGAQKVFVLDDSRSARAREANAAVVENLSSNGMSQVYYLGEEWQRGFVDRMISAFPDHENAIRYLLTPRPEGLFSAGRTLNLAMLALAGQRLVTFDDDYIVDRCWQHPEVDDSVLRFFGDRAHCVQGYESEAQMYGSNRELQLDALAEHWSILGLSVSSVLQSGNGRLPQQVVLDGLGGSFIGALSANSRVLTTANGIIGRPIAPSGQQGWFPDAETRPVWFGDKDYNAWIQGLNIYTSHKSPTLKHRSYGIPTGIDNTQIMPPTLPEGRREDTLFTFLLHRLHPAAVHFEFPWAVSHQREPLDWRQATVEMPEAMALSQYIILCLDSSKKALPVDATGREAFATIGSILVEKGAASDQALYNNLLSTFQKISSEHITRLLETLEKGELDDPAARADIERSLAVNQQFQISRPVRVLWEDSHSPSGKDAEVQWVREHLRLFGQSLLAWPDLWEYCRENPEIALGDEQAASAATKQRSA